MQIDIDNLAVFKKHNGDDNSMDRYVLEVVERFGPYYEPQCRVNKIWWLATHEDDLYQDVCEQTNGPWLRYPRTQVFRKRFPDDMSVFRLIPITVPELLTHQRNDFRLIGQALFEQDGARS